MKALSACPQKTTLENGVRILVDPDPRYSTVAVAISLIGGLRSETPERVGVTHLLEHVLFKRTSLYSPLDIARRLDEVGGLVNGFTDADNLCLHATVPSQSLEEIIALFAQMLRDPHFSDDDFEKEREVVRQEILELEDDPADVVYRKYCELFWPDSMLALPVCGTAESIAGLNPDIVREHLASQLLGSRVLIGVSGGIDAQAATEVVSRHFQDLVAGEFQPPLTPETGFGLSLTPHPVSQVHFVLGGPWPHLHNPAHTAADAIISVLGGGLSSRLFQKLREEHGLVYDVDCSSESFVDTASFEISAVVDRNNFKAVESLVMEEIISLKQHGVRAEELALITQMYAAEIALEQDSIEAKMWRLLECELLHGHYISAQEELEALRAVRPEQCQELMQEFLHPGSFVAAFAGDVGGLALSEDLQRWCSLSQ